MMPTQSLLVVGAGGHGRVVADAAAASGLWASLAFLDDRYPGLRHSGPWPVIGTVVDAKHLSGQFDSAVVGIGNNQRRLEILALLEKLGFALPSVRHPRAAVSVHAVLGRGTVVLANASVNIGAVLGDACIVNTNASVDHDCVLEHGVHVGPGSRLAGAVRAGTMSWIGIGASVREGGVIGARAIVGAGAVVIGQVEEGRTVVGVPARDLKGPLDE